MKTTNFSPAEAPSLREIQGAQASRLPSTQGRDGSPQPSLASPLRDAISRLVEAYRPQAIWLFGSQARGDAGHDSDFDLLVVVPDDADRQHRKAELAYRVLRSLGRAFDIAVWRHSTFQEQSRSATSLPSTVLREGILVYAS